jgi:peptidoglycan/xylan/chitin deacetylase (PgdA/CDA1 family)
MMAAERKDVRVALTFDFDACCVWIGTLGAKSPSMISRGEFGPIALRRILDLLDRFGIKSTFFVPGHSAVAFPEPTRMIRAAGHEIGHHGWVHENPTMLTPEQERHVLERGLEALDRIAGVRPVGYRSPAWDNSPATVSLLLEYGFEYESSLMGSDYAPYWCRVGDEFSTTEEYRWGRPVDLVEVPVAWHLDDFPPFEHVWLRSGAVLQGNAPPSSVGEIWLGEFEYLYHHVGQGILTITMHPQVIGRGHRLLFLERCIRHMAGHPGVTFTTTGDYVRHWRKGRKPELPRDAGPERSKAWEAPAPQRRLPADVQRKKK